jgi:Ca2+-binding RTX toxin-like protein
MNGGLGNDTYIVDDEKDTTDETGGGGADTVKSSAVSYALNTDVENLTLSGKAISGLGNLLANIIIGTTAGNMLSGDAGNDSLAGGMGNDTLDGGNDNDTLDGAAGADSFVGGLGDDTYRIDVIGDKIATGADAGTDTVESLITFALGAAQEHLTLIGAAAINGTGTDGSNVITGNAAANILSGGSKGETDTLIGGSGNDTYLIDASSDKVTEADKAGTDLVKSSADFALDANIENLTLIGSDDIDGAGNTLPNVIIGNAGANKLSGDDGNDTLTGGDGSDTLDGGLGNDAMTGGNHDDTYVVDSKTDKVTESAVTGGHDKVESVITYVLGANLEDLDLSKAGIANGTGNTLANLLIGSADANILDGKTGADTMKGGAGNDTYIIDNALDLADETGGSGLDTLVTPFYTTLAGDFAAFESLTLTGKALTGTGNAEANTIIGTSGANTLSGLDGNDTLDGGAGIDLLLGGAGDDSYGVDNAKDIVQETGSDTADLVTASIAIDLTLAAYAGIEGVTLIGTGGLKATGDEQDNLLTGNAGANLLSGNAGADTLVGGGGNDTLDGGADPDSLAGGLGNDTYLIADAGNTVTEAFGEGTDTVRSSLAANTLDANVENLVLLAGALAGTGNGLNNLLTGNDAANTLDGGAGIDTLVGGNGDDGYVVDDAKDVVTEAAGAGTGLDTVTSTAAAYTLGVNLEYLVLGSGALSGTGNTLNNTLTGNAGDNTLDGKTGKDHLVGDAGNDTYIVDNIGDIVDENGALGTDTVRSSIAFSLVESGTVIGELENLTLTGTAGIAGTGNDLANHLVGNAGANKLLGNGGGDVVEGGAGADTLDGGAGNDSLTGGAGNDRLNTADGDDTVFYTSKLDGKDIVDNFDGDAADGGQDVLNLVGLFDTLTLAGNREDHVSLVLNAAGGIDVRVDADGKAATGFELVVATLNLANPADAITAGQDIVVGT